MCEDEGAKQDSWSGLSFLWFRSAANRRLARGHDRHLGPHDHGGPAACDHPQAWLLSAKRAPGAPSVVARGSIQACRFQRRRLLPPPNKLPSTPRTISRPTELPMVRMADLAAVSASPGWWAPRGPVVPNNRSFSPPSSPPSSPPPAVPGRVAVPVERPDGAAPLAAAGPPLSFSKADSRSSMASYTPATSEFLIKALALFGIDGPNLAARW